MRSIPVLIAGSILASCTMAPPPPPHMMAHSGAELQRLLAGKVAQAPITCLGSYRSQNMQVINEDTIAFLEGNRRVTLAHTTGCSNLRPNGTYALVTSQYGSFGLCRGDMAKVTDLSSGIVVGSCAITGFTPYVMPR